MLQYHGATYGQGPNLLEVWGTPVNGKTVDNPGYKGLISVIPLRDHKVSSTGAASYPRLELGSENMHQEAHSIYYFVCIPLLDHTGLIAPADFSVFLHMPWCLHRPFPSHLSFPLGMGDAWNLGTQGYSSTWPQAEGWLDVSAVTDSTRIVWEVSTALCYVMSSCGTDPKGHTKTGGVERCACPTGVQGGRRVLDLLHFRAPKG